MLEVAAILSALTAVAAPDVSKFAGKAETVAAAIELHNIETATMAMMVDIGITKVGAVATATNDMSAFPAAGTGTPAAVPLYGAVGARYLNAATTTYWYSCATDGTVTQFLTAPEP